MNNTGWKNWKFNRVDRSRKKGHIVPIVGITGGIGSGKSLLCETFKQLGAFVIDADKVGKEVLEQDKDVFKDVVKQFGKNILDSNKKIDKKKLAGVVFDDVQKLEELNAIIHPTMIKVIEERIKAELKLRRKRMIVVDAALIFEAKVEDRFDYVVNVSSSIEDQIKRLFLRDEMPEEEVLRRMKSQIPQEIKKKKSDYNVENNGTIEELKVKAGKLFKEILVPR